MISAAQQDQAYDKAFSWLFYHKRFWHDVLAIVLCDALAISFSLVAANLMLQWINGVPFSISGGWWVVPVWTVFSSWGHLLPGWGIGTVDELRKLQSVLFFMFATFLMASLFSDANLIISRIVFLFTYLFASCLLPLCRSWVRTWLAHIGRWGVPVSVYGEGKELELFISMLKGNKQLGYQPVCVFSNETKPGECTKGVPVMGGIKNLNRRTPVALILQESFGKDQFSTVLSRSLKNYRKVVLIPDLLSAPSLWVLPLDFEGVLGLEITKNLLNPLPRALKIYTDYFLAVLTMPLWIPLVSILCFFIWMEDRANPFFRQERMGKKGRLFYTIKFRTMVPDAEAVLQQVFETDRESKEEWERSFKLKRDPRITRIGRLLRVTSLDELPQLFNVLNGTMSIVGPRPLPLYHFNSLPRTVCMLRNQVRPGITGLWQVSGRSEAGTAGMARWDSYYVRNWSVWLDIVILFRTAKAVLSAKGAY